MRHSGEKRAASTSTTNCIHNLNNHIIVDLRCQQNFIYDLFAFMILQHDELFVDNLFAFPDRKMIKKNGPKSWTILVQDIYFTASALMLSKKLSKETVSESFEP